MGLSTKESECKKDRAQRNSRQPAERREKKRRGQIQGKEWKKFRICKTKSLKAKSHKKKPGEKPGWWGKKKSPRFEKKHQDGKKKENFTNNAVFNEVLFLFFKRPAARRLFSAAHQAGRSLPGGKNHTKSHKGQRGGGPLNKTKKSYEKPWPKRHRLSGNRLGVGKRTYVRSGDKKTTKLVS